MRVKWRITSTSVTSGMPARSSSRCQSRGIISSIDVSSTSSARQAKPARPGCERSKINCSFWLGWLVTLVMFESIYYFGSFRGGLLPAIPL